MRTAQTHDLCASADNHQAAAQAQREQLDYASFLEIILNDEVNRRAHRRTELRLHNAGYEETCRLEDFDWSCCLIQKCYRDFSTWGAMPQRENSPSNRGNPSSTPSASSSPNSRRSAAWSYCSSSYPSGSMAW